MESPVTWHPHVLPANWTRAAQDLAVSGVAQGTYLAGGTGLALRFGHRRSADLDLFRPDDVDCDDVRDRLAGLVTLYNVELAPGTVYFELHGVKVSLLRYPYPLLFPLVPFDNLAVADPRDIACMKVDTIASRGARRDFIDLYVAAQHFGLSTIVDWFGAKYAAVAYNPVHILKSLAYFADAEQDPMPEMLVPLEWRAVTAYFTREVPRLARLP